MIIVREVFTCKPGQASKFAKLMKAAFPKDGKTKIMTDLVGNYNTVVMETEMENLVAFEKMMEAYKSGKPDPNMDPKVAEQMSHYTEMYLTGRREIYQVWD
ncbi:MAG: hypothetical protein HY545_00565 [Candidatus Doudnabacteria bacterium]|nr:hypothetical protein [Candidatus Doudnabacteria bacterium]